MSSRQGYADARRRLVLLSARAAEEAAHAHCMHDATHPSLRTAVFSGSDRESAHSAWYLRGAATLVAATCPRMRPSLGALAQAPS
jgi:hypothetical protein